MGSELEAPPWVLRDELARLREKERAEAAASGAQEAMPPREIETIDFNVVKGELEGLERRMVWRRRFKFLASLLFILTFALFIYMMPFSIGLSIISLGGLFVRDSMALKLIGVLGAALSGILISLVFGLSRLGTIGLAASASAPLFYLSNIKALLLAFIHF